MEKKTQKKVTEKAARIQAALKLIDEDYPDVAAWVRGSVAHIRVKYAGVFAAAATACAVLDFLGVIAL